MSANEDTLARLTFNAAAMRDYIGDDAKGVRLKIERGVVTLRPAKAVRGVDVIAIERRPRGTLADIGRGVFPRRLLQGLFKAGLSENRPYFVLGSAGRGWLGIEHLPDQQPPPRQPLMVVSDFDAPPAKVPAKRAASPGAIDMALWQKFLRALTAQRVIPEETWTAVYRMIQSAEEIVARKVRGRQSQARVSAERLLAGVTRNAEKFLAWRERQPEFGDDVVGLLTRLGVELSTAEDMDTTVAEAEPEPAEEPVDEPVAPRTRRGRRKSRSGLAPTRQVPTDSVLDVEPGDPWVIEEVTEEVVVEVQTDTDPAPEVAGDTEGGDPEAIQTADEGHGEPDPIDPIVPDDLDAAAGAEPEPEPEPEPQAQAEAALDQAILASWERHEDMEPSISTERLMAMVGDDTGADNARQIEALVRAGWPVPRQD